jgi:WD40 repeat protein
MSARFDRTGERLVTFGYGAVVWDPATGREVARVPAADGGGGEFLPTGEWLTTGKNAVSLWAKAEPFEPAGRPLHTLGPGFEGWTRTVAAVTRDGRRLAVVDPVAGQVVVVSTRGGPDPVRLKHPYPCFAAFSPDGTLIATTQNTDTAIGNVPRPLQIWDAATGRRVRVIPDHGLSSVAFTPDGRWLVAGTVSHYQFWAVGSWEPGLRIPRTAAGFGFMAFSPDGRVMACVPEPWTVKLLDTATGGELARLTPPTASAVEDLCFSPDGTQLVVSTGTAVAYLWDLRLIRRQLREMNLDWDPPME